MLNLDISKNFLKRNLKYRNKLIKTNTKIKKSKNKILNKILNKSKIKNLLITKQNNIKIKIFILIFVEKS